ncbi:hypothetical protein LRS13_20580 [Svornostia abyssi]|uniref:Guanylate cyclase domain-containing protein n=1 Tax=Svornostia abyssi TaxID=2898438 RepID=A0ABY5PEK3_9ACTN|nr:hypothetical protein LRS13_20580 [Parviterribacteraceae bacterium J379]
MIASAQHTFVFADLAGYTALTDIHGDEMAADLAGQFCCEVGAALPPGAEDLKSLGDACMVHVETAAGAVQFALALFERVVTRSRFPAVRVGMHTGTAVERGGDWFGQTVNAAARIAELAGPDEILLSSVTRESAGGGSQVHYEDLGVRDLRNIRAPQQLFRAVPATCATDKAARAIDPVCRMRVALDDAVVLNRRDTPRAFCSQRCADEFARDPHRYPIPGGAVPALRPLA